MKKTFFYLFSALLLATTLTSCLGDNESYFESTDYGVIREQNGSKVLNMLVNGYNIYILSAPNLANYANGDLVRASYKINFDNANNAGIITADYITIQDNNVYPVAEQQEVIIGEAPASLENNKLRSFNMPIRIINSYLENKTLFSYSYALKKGEEMNGLSFYYDESNQADAPADTYIIDVRLNVSGTATTTEGTLTEGATAADFSQFKELKKPGTIPTEGTSITLWFRFFQDNASTPTISKIGSMFYR